MAKIKEVRCIRTRRNGMWVIVKVLTDQPGLYGIGSAIGLAIGLIAFQWLAPIMHKRLETVIAQRVDQSIEERWQQTGGEFSVRQELWQPYTSLKLAWLRDRKYPVFVDFTADW